MTSAALTYPTPALEAVSQREHAEASLWRRWSQDKDIDCRLKLFDLYTSFALSIARHQFSRRPAYGLERGDFEQFAFAGLLEALDRFDPVAGCTFKTFARYRIVGAIADGSMRSSEGASAYASARRMERERLRSLASEIEPGNAVDHLRDLVARLAVSVLLETVTQETLDTVPDPNSQDAFESVRWNQMKSSLRREIDQLPPREAEVIKRHYLLGVSFTQVAELLHITKGRVSQLHSQAIGRLRGRIRS